VHLHEIGSIDTIIDIAGTLFCLTQLKVFEKINPTKIFFNTIAVGGGTVTFSHGTLPVPAPATAKILQKYNLQYHYGPIDTELATPTGVSILALLSHEKYAIQTIPPAEIKITQIGIGVGAKDFPKYANILRTISAETSQHLFLEHSIGKEYPIHILETNVDDVKGEILGHLVEILMQKKAMDVSLIPCTTKKNRPGIIIRVICMPETTEELITTMILETGTLGVRISKELRYCVDRDSIVKEIELSGQMFKIHIKRAFGPNNNIIQQKIEFEDLKHISEVLKIPIRMIEAEIYRSIS
jgi:uncharacterized protein (TIGR00299 family) protein